MLAMHSVAKTLGRRAVINDVSLFVRRGEMVGLLGPNGAGKTTTFQLLTGIIATGSGRITLDDVDITQLSFYERARLGIAYLAQEPFMIRGLTVEDNVELVLEAREASPASRRQISDSLLREFGVEHVRKSIAAHLSGGERRRVEIALMLACAPTFVLLDEPLAGIDPIAISHLHDIVRYLTTREVGVLITDHKARELLSFVDRSYIISDGRVLADGTTEKLMADEEVRRIYLGEDFRL